MIDFIEYVVSELKSKKVSKADALALIQQFSQRVAKATVIHPLLHANTSAFGQQNYAAIFTGSEFFLKDHRVQGRPLLPGVAYLEMTRVAIAQALPQQVEPTATLELHDVVWAQPVVVTRPTEVNVALFTTDAEGHAVEGLNYEIFSKDEEQEIVHCQGRAIFTRQSAPEKLEIEQLKIQMRRGRLEAGVVYAAFNRMGIDFGPAFQSIVEIAQGDDQVLAQLHLPAVVEAVHADYWLHPSLMDGALQASIGLVENVTDLSGQARLPFALEHLRVMSRCTRDMYSWVRYSPGSQAADRVVKLDIDLCDEQGNVCVQMRGFSSRLLNSETSSARLAAKPTGVLLAEPEWQTSAIEAPASPRGNAYTEQHVILCELPTVDIEKLGSLAAPCHCLLLQAKSEETIAARYGEYALACFERIQTIVRGMRHGKVLMQIVVADNPDSAVFAGLIGLLKTAELENPQFAGQLILTGPQTTAGAMAERLLEEKAGVLESQVKYADGARQVLRWREVAADQGTPLIAFKEDGVYLITGGLGGLGILFAEEILQQTTRATIVLTGRSTLTPAKQALLEGMSADRMIYRQVDISDPDQVTHLIGTIKEEYRHLNGILHCAGMVADNFILKKASAEFRQVLEPKVVGTFNLDQFSRDVALDFFVLFSSISGAMGNLGQSDYAAANGFMDQFAAYRNRQVMASQRHGRTLSINWPLWQSGGMGTDQASRERLEQATGVLPMQSATGMQTFYRSLTLPYDQVLVVEGDLEVMRRALLAGASVPAQPQAEPPLALAAEMDVASLTEKTQNYLRGQFSGVLKLPSHKIDSQAPLENYGIDSIVAMKLTSQLEDTFGSLSKTLFFEYQTIAELAEYFVQAYPARLAALFTALNKVSRPATVMAMPPRTLSQAPPGLPSRRRRWPQFHETVSSNAVKRIDTEPIAIIGLSGRYPESADIETYWQNLREGKDCIIEVPKERWDWREYYSEDRGRRGHHYSKWGGFIAGVDEFDPLFFNISPVEAELLDPQERLFLQHAWMAVEDAGYTRATLQIPCEQDLAGQVGVYVGVMYNEYQLFGAEASMLGKRMGFAINSASIANRVSYILNLHGPSMTLDTMCSSSLTAIHVACQDLKQGRTSMAIAGGVNVSIHPNKYLMVSAGQAISSAGHCQSFGEGGDGYIPAEGVGAVVLKRLSEAKRDGDHIYGVIRGSALNHGGKTNGYTVPNPQAQASAIRRALSESHTDPHHISYIEAHGTGTKLGDPIEIAALSKAFDTSDTGFCLIGSAKSNIGHCESAAGIAGLTKVLLQMRYHQIAPSLHSAQLNPHIDFSKTPFVVNQALRPWEQPVIDGRTLPRIAGISSFGAGGSNAHMIVEEYEAAVPQPMACGEVVILLSARTAEQLLQKADDLLNFVRPRQDTIDLVSVAYTLQTGREAMDERLGFVVSSAGQLVEKLQAFVAGAQQAEDAYLGQVKRSDDALSLFRADADLQQTVDKWIVNRKFSKLLDLWVKGLEPDWNKFYSETRPQRMSLPTYPFARERYWIDIAAARRVAAKGAATTVLHPLLHSNMSNLNEQRYRSIFTGEEFFLADHQVTADGRASQKVLPGVAYLEMARAAIEQALPARPESALELRNTVWAQPIVVNQTTQVNISLLANDDDQIDYEIYSENAGQEIVHCQGRAVFSRQPEPARLDIDRLRERMGQGKLEAESVYETCARIGLAYGPAFRGITAIYRGDGEVLARLRLPSAVADGVEDYVLHPSLMDGALQAAVGLIEAGPETTQPRLPFALETLRIVSPCMPEMIAWTRYAQGSQASDDVVKLDIDLCDERGNVCVQMHGFSSRVLSQKIITKSAKGSLLATPVWQSGGVAVSAGASSIQYAEHHIILCERSNADSETLTVLFPHSHCVSLQAEAQKNIAERYGEYALACFELVKAILESKPEGKVLVQIVIVDYQEQVLLSGLSGLLKTAGLENPRLIGQLILVPPGMMVVELGRHLQDEKSRGVDTLIRYQQDARQVLQWEEIAADREKPPSAFKDQGVYLITGGLGGLGLLFANEILEQTREARVVLTGRSESSAEKQTHMDGFSAHAGRLSYRQMDLANLVQVEQVIAAIKAEYGQLNGIIHSAGMIADHLLLTKARAEFAQVLAPKVNGTFNLDQASQHVELDFFVLFSSIVGVTGNPGQADYATANGFMDQFAAYRNRQVAAGQRYGRTRSINWPLWQAGGMGIDPGARELLEQTTGIQPMQTETGLDAFHRSLALPCDRMLVVEGDLTQIRRAMLAGPSVSSEPEAEPAMAAPGIDSGGLAEKTQDYLRKEFSEVLKLPSHKIDPRAALENYGIDSVLAMRLTNQLEKTFGSLSKTLFFEYQTIAALAGYFVRAHPGIVREKFGLLQETSNAKGVDRTPLERPPAPVIRRKTRSAGANPNHQTEIAIIGLAGRYPQAENLQEFWRNLQNGRDSITEIPLERWDHQLYFDLDQNKPGKTYSKWGGFIADVDKFDPLFFNISPKEAAVIDPQERVFLETAWETIEDAGYTRESISRSRVGVYVGVMWGQYELFGAETISRGDAAIPVSSHASIANRVSYFFDFHGPSIALDTMCSSSLTAIHLACEELRKGEIDAAIAGGVNLTLHPNKYLSLSQGKFMASDGKCRSFGAGGDGYVPGEGVGAVLLKPLDKALRDGDQIYAVIKASSVNHGGKTNGYTVPNPNAQGDLIRAALEKARIDPRTLGYVETHGTGTTLGDPIEITGLLKAFEGSTDEKQFCPIGSVKSNIGHLESAAGIAAVTKALLQIRHKQLVPSLYAEPLNPNINFADSPFYVQTELTEWKSNDAHPRRVGVSSFGAGGSNAHLILEEYAEVREPGAASHAVPPEPFILSARNTDALSRYAERVVSFLDHASGVSMADIAYTSQVGRTPMDARLAIITSSVDDLRDKLNEWIALRKSGDTIPESENVFYGNLREAPYSAASLIEGQAGKAFLRDLLMNRDLERIARLWTLGADVDWSLLDRQGNPKKISLPTYPFAKERCWINQKALSPPSVQKNAVVIRNVGAIERAEEKRRTYYSTRWTLKALAAEDQKGAVIGPILILDASEQLFLAMREQRKDGAVVWVKPGKAFEEIEPNIYVVDPEREEQFHELVANLMGKALLPGVVLHHTPKPCNLEDRQEVARQLDHGLYALFSLCKVLVQEKQQVPPRIMSVFSSDSEGTAPMGAAIGGFFRTLTLEDPRYLAKAVEIQDAGELSPSERAAVIWDEIYDRNWTTQEIRYCDRTDGDKQGLARFTSELVPYTPAVKTPETLPLKQNGVYLITGGLGGLGIIFSDYLAKRFQAKLVLVGRSVPNARQEETISRLKGYGAEILVLQADVSKLEDMETVVREAKARFSEINGVIHAAGVNRDAFILKKTREQIEAVLAPKVYGAINVDLATHDENLDFFALFSSVAGVLGNVGQSDYAYANHFLDSFAERRDYLRRAQKRSGRTLSIDWPLWEEGGMSIPQDAIALLEKRTGTSPLPTQDGIQYWEDFLRSEGTQAVALYGIPSRIASYIAQQPAKAHRNISPSAEGIDSAALFARTELYLKTLIGEEIKLDPDRIDSADRLESFGIDSVMINRINAQLEQDLGALPKTLLYEHETVRDLARFLVKDTREALIGLFDSVVAAGEQLLPPTQFEKEDVQDEVSTSEEAGGVEEIAIVGIHVSYPHSANLGEYWDNLKHGRDLIDLVPPSRWDYEEFYSPDPAAAADGKIYCKWGGFLEHFDKFDPQFFKISAAEAKIIDPQERIFLESVWSAIEDAGYTRDTLKTRFPKAGSADVGVFVGVTTNSYHLLAPDERRRGNFASPSAMPWSIANRASYFFDFNGPSLPVDTACSSSLVAVHLACESLRNRECQAAVAGGVNLYLHPSKYQGLCQRRALSLDGKCRSYGAGDDGFVPGEGVGTLVLKPLHKAVEDQDHIYAVIRASAFEHSGRSNGYSAPNPNAQASLISRMLEKAHIDPESIGYVEGHGTGTQLGDSLEIAALTQAFERQTTKKQFCAIGCVKANVGHSESAAGVAGVAKVVVQMEHRQLAPSIYSDEQNPLIEFEDSPFYLQHGLSEWESSPDHPRRALINSFGAGGVNACVVLEEYETPHAAEDSPVAGPYLFTLSARNEDQLREYADRLLIPLRSEPYIDLADFCYTLQAGREVMEERLAAVVSDVGDLIDRLSDWRKRGSAPGVYRGSPGPRRGSRRSAKLVRTAAGDQGLTELAARWVAGEDVDWETLYSRIPRRMSVPTYPFARERYWVSDSLVPEKPALSTAQPHPLIAQNSSTLREVSFRSSLSDTAFYAVDHQVYDERIFPGAGFLEMACISANIAGEQKVRKIKDVVWIRPLSFRTGPQALRTVLRNSGDIVEYEISSLDDENESIVHCEGRVTFANGSEDPTDAEERIAIQALKAQCVRPEDPAAYYDAFRTYGLQYGPSFRTIRELYVNSSFALSRLEIAEHLKGEFGQFILHPSIIDGALQTIAGLLGGGGAATPYLPFALDELDLIGPVPQTCYAYAERAGVHAQNRAGVTKFNIRILNESGDVLIKIKNLYVRPLAKPQRSHALAETDVRERLALVSGDSIE